MLQLAALSLAQFGARAVRRKIPVDAIYGLALQAVSEPNAVPTCTDHFIHGSVSMNPADAQGETYLSRRLS
jgi:hypothetical protein